MADTKYPKQYQEGRIGNLRDPFRPEFRYDSRGRLIMPLPGYSKMMLSVEPGSKNVSQGTESESGGAQTDPGSLSSGYIYASTAIKVGPKGGWVTQIAGGDFEYPFSYFNETTNEINFYLDKAGNVYVKGTIIATIGQIGGWTISVDELYAVLTSGGNTYRIGMKPTAWPFYAFAPVVDGIPQPENAVFRVNYLGQIWCSQLNILSGTGVANLADAGDLAVKDSVDLATSEVLNKVLDNILDGTVYGRIKKTGLTAEGFISYDVVVDGTTFKKVKATALNAEGLVLLDQVVDGTHERILGTHVTAGKIYIFSDTQFASGYNPTTKENQVYKQSSAPPSPATGVLWIDTSASPNLWKRWSGSAWVKATPESADINALLTINAPAEAGAQVYSGKSISLLTDRTLAFISDVTTRKAVTADEKTGASLGYDILYSKLTAYGLSIWTANSSSRVELTSNGLKGYNAGVLQVEIRASDGKIYAGAGAVILDATGLHATAGDISGALVVGTITAVKIQTTSTASRGIKYQVSAYGAIADAYIEFWTSGGDSSIMYIRNSDAKLYIESPLKVVGNVEPNTNNLYDLGTSSVKWRDLHLSRYGYIPYAMINYLSQDLNANTYKITNCLFQARGLSSAPTGADGMMYFDTTLKRFRVYQNGAWRSIWTD